MKREDYIFAQAKALRTDMRKRRKQVEKLQSDVTLNQRRKITADINWLSMEIGQTEERLKFALGCINLNDVRKEWHPSGFHTYPGIKNELEKIVFE